jgi:hypothetical protein
MAKLYDQITDRLAEFIQAQPLFFVASAPLAADSHVNLSPKGLDCLRILSPTQVAYLDLTGSGNETSAHIQENGRITLMFCAFEGPPRILRLFGEGHAHPVGSPRFEELVPRFERLPGTRSIITVAIERVQTSCGYSIPFMDYRDERPTLQQWAERRGDDGLRQYWADRNVASIDGLPALDPQ